MTPQSRLTAAVVALACLAPASIHGQFGIPGFGQQDQQLVATYDKDGDGRLNQEERNAARQAVRGTQFGGPQFRRGPAAATPGPRLTPEEVRPYPSTPLYDLGTLRTIFLEFENAAWESELSAFYGTDVEVPATMTVDGRVYKDVGVHFRGNSSYRSIPEGLKRSLNISVDFTVDGQDLGGYQTLNLLNANNDPTFLRAVLYTEISRRYIPTPKMNYMRVVINGESWGVYLNSQQFNGDFVKEHFDGKGARWKVPGRPNGRGGLEYLGADLARYRSVYEIKSKDEDASWKALAELCRVLNETPAESLETALSPLLDIDSALRFLAVEVALVNSDGYWTRASDYSLYLDPAGRFHVVPYDINEALGGGGGGSRFGGGSNAQLDPLVAVNDPAKPLRSKLLAVPALREKYLGYVRDIATNWLDWNAVRPMLEASHRLIAADVSADTRKLYDMPGFDAGIAATGNPLKAFLDARRAFLLAYPRLP